MANDDTNRCPSCDYLNRPENRFCTRCGSRLQNGARTGPRLVVLEGEAEQNLFQLVDHRSTVGRDGDNLVVLGDRQISKHHAAVLFEDGHYWIEDLNSRNGVYVNGKRIERRARLLDGSLVKLGSTILRFEAPDLV